MWRRLYDWTLSLASRPYALPALAAISFAESSIFPIPPDLLLVPMVLARPDRALRIAVVCTVASVLGGLAGYALGALLFETVGRPIIELYGYMDRFAIFQERYADWGAWIVAIGGLTPVPYKVITIASGAVSLDPVVFVVASVLSRGARFGVEAALLWRFGPSIRRFVEARLGLLMTLSLALLIGGFAIVRYLG